MLSEQEIIRRESLKKLIELNINPYPAAEYPINVNTTEILSSFSDEGNTELLNNISIAGRLMSKRIMGNASFCDLQDNYGKIQIYVKRDEICPDEDKNMYNVVFKKLLDIGDIIGIKGYAFRTQMG